VASWPTSPGIEINSTSPLGDIDSGDKFLDIAGENGTPPVINLVNSLDTDGGTIGGLIFSRSLGEATTHTNAAGIIGIQQNGSDSAGTRGAGLSFWTKAGGAPGEKMRITRDGNVGIGTTSPNKRLTIKQPSGDQFSGVALEYPTNLDTWAIYQTGAAADDLRFDFASDASGADESGDFATILNLQSNGNVGIGTTSPDEKLHVNGNLMLQEGSPELVWETESASHYNWRIAAQEDISQAMSFQRGDVDADATDDSFDTLMIIKADTGNVGIGTTSPGYKLDVDGGVRVSNAAGLSESNCVISSHSTGCPVGWTQIGCDNGQCLCFKCGTS